jgi:hypothetical protein
MSHTPGPWSVVIDQDNGLMREIAAPCYEHKECGKTIVFIERDRTKPFQSSHGEHMRDNAHLIAAAPDLLSACQTVKKWLCDTKLIDPKDPIANPAFIKANNAVLKAIAKAEGKS